MKHPAIYITANKINGTLYTGVTSNLPARIWKHKNKISDNKKNSFTSKYDCTNLVYYEVFDTMDAAIKREKQLKGGSRKKKTDLINSFNPQWKDLYEDII